MSLADLMDLTANAKWFSAVGTYQSSDTYTAITSLLDPKYTEPWDWLPTGRDEADPLHSLPLKTLADQQGKLVEAKEASLMLYKAALLSLRLVYDDDPNFVYGPHNFVEAAKGGALYASRQAALEIVVGQTPKWGTLITLYSQGFWPCGYTKKHTFVVY